MPHGWFRWALCPWPGCSFQVDLIDFRLEAIDPELYARGVDAWHRGHALVGPCPVCGRLVAFSSRGMDQAKSDLLPVGSVSLPAGWVAFAVFVDQDGKSFRP